MTIAVLASLAAALGNLGQVFDDSAWWFVAVSVATITVVGMVIVRSLTRIAVLPTLVGLVVLLGSLSFSFAPAEAFLLVIPTPEAFGAFARLIGEGIYSINNQSVPADPVPGIIFLLTVGAALLAMLIDTIAEVVARPALIGIPLLGVLLAPTFVAPEAGDPFFFCLTAAAYLVVLYLALGEPRTRGATGVGASAVALALLLPVLLPPIIDKNEQIGPPGLAVNVSAFITLGENLRQGRELDVLSYVTDSGRGEYLRLTTIEDFRGSKWSPSPAQTFTDQSLEFIGSIPGLNLDKATTTTQVAITVGSMGGHWLPAPYAPRTVTGADDDWSFDPATLTLMSATESARGEEYDVLSERPVLSEVDLRETGVTIGTGLGAAVDDYLALPDGLPASVSETAIAVVGSASNNFDKAIALQDYFTGGEFRYSEIAPVQAGYDGTSAEAIGLFLEAKSGYCVHFSSSMAVMARAVGIPSRIVIGFTPGKSVRKTSDVPAHFEVTTRNLHAWPELWFDGFGWVRFEPTVSRGEAPVFDTEASPDRPSDSPSAGPSAAPSAAPSATASRTASPSPTAAASGSSSGGSSLLVATIIVAVLIVAVFVVLLLPLVPFARRTTRRVVRVWRVWRTGSAREAWNELVDTAVDFGWDAATATPRQLAELLRRGAPPAVVPALARLRNGIEATAYSPVPQPAALDDLRVLRRYLSSRATTRQRLTAIFAPASVAGWLRR